MGMGFPETAARLMTPTNKMLRWGSLGNRSFAVALSWRKGESLGKRLAGIGFVVWFGPGCRDYFDPRGNIGRPDRDCRRRRCRKPPPSGADRLGEFPCRVWRHSSDFLGGYGNRPARHAQTCGGEHWDRGGELCRPLSRLHGIRPFPPGLALAASTDRRNFTVDDIGCGCVRRDGRDRLQQERARQAYSRGVFYHRSWNGARARDRIRPLRYLAWRLCRG